MKLIGLHGKAGAGKDTFADVAVEEFGFEKRGFADPLYAEVATNFRVGVGWLRDRNRKEVPQDLLRLARCYDEAFIDALGEDGYDLMAPRSPRWLLQKWGTEYRRGQNEDYWLDRMAKFLTATSQLAREHAIVIPDCRFGNEAELVRAAGGTIVEVRRPGAPGVHAHSSESDLPPFAVDYVVLNDGTLSRFRDVAFSTIRGLYGEAAARSVA